MKATVVKINGADAKSVIVMVQDCEWNIERKAVYTLNRGFEIGQVLDIPEEVKIYPWQEVTLKSGKDKGKTVMLNRFGL
tara:strand:+ start:65 stop:301 length:237 start_codon:yes stop_codon:yes gene_type:complete